MDNFGFHFDVFAFLVFALLRVFHLLLLLLVVLLFLFPLVFCFLIRYGLGKQKDVFGSNAFIPIAVSRFSLFHISKESFKFGYFGSFKDLSNMSKNI